MRKVDIISALAEYGKPPCELPYGAISKIAAKLGGDISHASKVARSLGYTSHWARHNKEDIISALVEYGEPPRELPYGAVNQIAFKFGVDGTQVWRISRSLGYSSQSKRLNKVGIISALAEYGKPPCELPYGTLRKIAKKLGVHEALVSKESRSLGYSCRSPRHEKEEEIVSAILGGSIPAEIQKEYHISKAQHQRIRKRNNLLGGRFYHEQEQEREPDPDSLVKIENLSLSVEDAERYYEVVANRRRRWLCYEVEERK